MNTKLKNAIRIFLPLILGSLVAFIIKDYMDYSTYVKPFLSPPAIVFPIVWTILYLLMGISYYLYRKEQDDQGITFLYYTQLFVNLTWPIFFFRLKWWFFSILWIILLFILVLFYIKKMFDVRSKISAYLLIPYLLWIVIATYLNIGIYLLN